VILLFEMSYHRAHAGICKPGGTLEAALDQRFGLLKAERLSRMIRLFGTMNCRIGGFQAAPLDDDGISRRTGYCHGDRPTGVRSKTQSYGLDRAGIGRRAEALGVAARVCRQRGKRTPSVTLSDHAARARRATSYHQPCRSRG